MTEKNGMDKKNDSEMIVSPDFRKVFVDGFVKSLFNVWSMRIYYFVI